MVAFLTSNMINLQTRCSKRSIVPSLLTYTMTIYTAAFLHYPILGLRGPDDFSEWVSRYIDLKIVR